MNTDAVQVIHFGKEPEAEYAGSRRGASSQAGHAEPPCEFRDGAVLKQAQLGVALDAAQLGTWQANLATGEFRASARARALHGLDPAASLDEATALALVHPEDRERVRTSVQQALREGEDYRAEFRTLWPDGTVRRVMSMGRPLPAVDGRTSPVLVGCVRDVTEEREAEERLQESEVRFRTCAEVLLDPLGIYEAIRDASGRIVDFRVRYVNAAAEEANRMPREEQVGRTLLEILPAHRESGLIGEYARVVETGEPLRKEQLVYSDRYGDGRELERAFDIRVARLGDGIVATWRDVTERVRAEHRLRESEERLRTVLDTLPVAVYISDDQGRILEANARAEEIWGKVPRVGLDGYAEYRAWWPATGQPVRAEEWGLWRAVSAGEVSGPEEMDIQAFDGERRTILNYARPIHAQDGRITGGVAVNVDVTALKRAERELERTNRDLVALNAVADAERRNAEEANRAKTEFLAAMSHDLRMPLNAIGGYADLLEMGIHGPVTDAQRQALARISLNQKHLLALISDILNFAKAESGTLEYHLRPLAVAELADGIEALTAPQISGKGLAYSYSGCGERIWLLGDEERVRQILLNLLGNAIKFTPAGGWIALSCDADEAKVHLRVRDNGPGIAPERLEAVFNPFVQGGNHPGESDGVGLGLAICRELARGMAGDLTVESTPGEGSTFTLSLTRSAPPLEEGD